ncbi:tetratricopeptide repeat protein [Gilliamella sp. Imp1-1]|uniref:tetratricopeptide repeat protein n=1 Tax=Gilliamella sp. Imp1-1 TaxID=3120248 RepID=UPI00159F2BB5|nr:tetratricopeptide repeat protein [Gilliamella apicola]
MPIFATQNIEYNFDVEYKKATEQNSAEAQNRLGYMYQYGLNVQQDYAKAIEWYQKSANQNYADAQVSLGYMYNYGLGVKKNLLKAKQLYEKAASNGYALGLFNLGALYEFAEKKHYRKGIEQNSDNNVINQDYVKAGMATHFQTKKLRGKCFLNSMGGK